MRNHFCNWWCSSNYISTLLRSCLNLSLWNSFILLKPLDIFLTLWNTRKRYVFEKGNIYRDAKEGVDKVFIEEQKSSDIAGETDLHVVSHFNTKHFVLWTTPKDLEQQWRNRLNELRIRRATLKKNRIVPCEIVSCLCQHSQLCLSHRCKQCQKKLKLWWATGQRTFALFDNAL